MEAVATGRGGLAFAKGHDSRCLLAARPALPDGTCPVLVTGYDEASDLLKDHRFSRARLSEALPLRGPALRMSMTEEDPPRHAQIRRLVSRAFSPRHVGALRPNFEVTAEHLISRLLKNGPAADVHRDFSRPFAYAAHYEILGIPARHRDDLLRWSDRRSENSTSPARVHAAEVRLHERISEVFDDRREPPTGLFAELGKAHEDGRFDRSELIGVAASLFFDGHRLAAGQITNALLCLLTQPAQLDLLDLLDLPGLDRAIEELLRFSPAISMTMPRMATEDLVLGGRPVQAGEVVAAVLPLVNRDPAVVAHTARLDLTRPDAHHLSFGHGIHYCLGAHLTRVLLRVALTTLPRRLPGLRLAVREEDLTWFITLNQRGLRALPVSWLSCRRTPRRHNEPWPSSSSRPAS